MTCAIRGFNENVLIMAAVFVAAAATARSQAQPIYFPLAVGNKWTYQLGVSADRQFWEVTKQETIKQTEWFVIEVFSAIQNADGKAKPRRTRVILTRFDAGGRLVTLDKSKGEAVWVDFATNPGQAYPSPGLCHSKATNSPTPERFTVLYERGCSDAGLLDESFVPHVGLESFTMDSFAEAHNWHLIAAHVDGKDLQP